ncbi:MAG: GNAT family N-acetyltransferase [Chloroflexi bacterium]|nr:GNAT family N-acetyltransferase [Chloroflexota bacterium]
MALRPIEATDEPFLYTLYASTRQSELDLVDWTDAAKAAFLRQQFAAQHTYYQAHYLGAAFELILLDRHPIGRLYVARWPDQIRVVDIALLPEYRGSGIGTYLLRALQRESSATDKPLTIHVERFNPALALYTRLGFTQKEDRGVYLLLEWSQLKIAS